MRKAIRYVSVSAVIAGAIAALVYYWSVPPAVLRETGKTDSLVISMDESVMNFESEVKSHASETITRTVIIREQVVAEVRALDGDGLSRLAIAEIELFRARAGDSSSPRPAWVDGAE